MTALKIIGVLLLIFLLIGFLRFGVIVSFGESLRVRLRVGVIRLTVCPRGKKSGKTKPKEEAAAEKKKKAGKRPPHPRLTADELFELLEIVLEAFGSALRRGCRRVRIDPLELTVVFGGGDPASVARTFGTANALMYALMPRVEETFYIPDPSLHLRMDFGQERSTAAGVIGVSLRLCDVPAVLFTFGIPTAKWFLRFRKAHRNDAPADREPAADGKEKDGRNDTGEQIA